MFSFDTSHPTYKHCTIGAKCLKCFTDAFYYKGHPLEYWQRPYNNPTARTCKCNAIGIAVDDEGTFYIYVDDIRTVHLGHFIFDKDGKFITTEWWNISGSFYYTPLNFKHEPIQYKDITSNTSDSEPDNTTKKRKYTKNTHMLTDPLYKALKCHEDCQSRMHFYSNNWDI